MPEIASKLGVLEVKRTVSQEKMFQKTLDFIYCMLFICPNKASEEAQKEEDFCHPHKVTVGGFHNETLLQKTKRNKLIIE